MLANWQYLALAPQKTAQINTAHSVKLFFSSRGTLRDGTFMLASWSRSMMVQLGYMHTVVIVKWQPEIECSAAKSPSMAA